MVPPPLKPPSLTATMDELPPLRRIRFRLWQIGMATGTILATVWFFTLSTALGVIAVLVAKHILVAILAAGLRFPEDEITDSL